MLGDYANVYAQMADEELLALVLESDELIDEARNALWIELHNRGLRQEARQTYQDHRAQKVTEQEPPEKLTTIATFNDSLGLNLARTTLEQEGIPCFVADERMNRLLSFAVGPTRLQVRECDAPRAVALLREDERMKDFVEQGY
ncbi:DUF2007 domain-containing protein [Acidobacteriia bacterium AH_259_A11_L15]|nr:DUF2007 domain-containing protein [Acidobacteriia bacterium AH_259_A11_L15]